VDWEQQEFGIAAALSGDNAMQTAYLSGDPYLEFAKQSDEVPRDATKATHPAIREQFKTCVLGVQYGMGYQSLAQRLGSSEARAQQLLQLHRDTYSRFWDWSEAMVDHAMIYGQLETVFGWKVHVGDEPNTRSLANFPMQANGAEMLRLACCTATEGGLRVCAPVHDAILIEAPTSDVESAVADCQAAMREASKMVLGGFPLRTDYRIIRSPDRYMDPRGEEFWKLIWAILAPITEPCEATNSTPRLITTCITAIQQPAA
jgi:DNA polymerase I-like protein with 3'-5' exonuclease and polymerase domains